MRVSSSSLLILMFCFDSLGSSTLYSMSSPVSTIAHKTIYTAIGTAVLLWNLSYRASTRQKVKYKIKVCCYKAKDDNSLQIGERVPIIPATPFAIPMNGPFMSNGVHGGFIIAQYLYLLMIL